MYIIILILYYLKAFRATLRDEIIKRSPLTSKKLQSKDINLGYVVSLYNALILYVSSMRDMYDAYETKAKL